MLNLIGQCLGQYEIVALLGKGGTAAVYRARQLTIKREVAVKVIKPDLAETEGFARRLEREAETIAALSHRHIVRLFDYGQHGEVVYLVMELLTGGSLSEQIKRGPLPPESTNHILGEIASALDFAHRRGVIHRDLKPQNVLFDEDGSAVLTDFGLAKLLHGTTALTQSGAVMGTPTYMAPEQWRAEPLDARTDVYALGNILFEMLTGRPPFIADTLFTMLHLHVNEPPPPMRSVNPAVPYRIEQVVKKALAKDPAQRFDSAPALADAFRAALQSTEAPTLVLPDFEPNRLSDREADRPPVQPPTHDSAVRRRAAKRARSRQPRNRAIPVIVGVAVLAVLAVIIGLLSNRTVPAATEIPEATQISAVVPTPTTSSPSPVPPTPTSRNAVLMPTVTGGVRSRPPGTPLRGDVLAYCESPTSGEPHKGFPDGTAITIYWSWFARTPEQIKDHLDYVDYDIRLDGKMLGNWREYQTEVLHVRDRHYVYWYVPIGTPTPGEHKIDYKVSWKQQITDGFKTFGPGGQVEDETGTCTFNIG
jgi:serine/threonine protein kinase